MANLAYQVTNFAYQGDGAFAYQGSSGAQIDVAIRNFSLRNWRRWKREELEEGKLPQDEKEEALEAVKEAVQASRELASGALPAQAALLRAMEARQRFEDLYKAEYQEAYVAEIVSRLWIEEMKRLRTRKAAWLLLMH